MPYTPVELRHVRLARELFGFNRDETTKMLEEVADSFGDVWRERGELSDKVEDLEVKLDQFRQREELLSATLLAAERSASEARDAARREAELIVAEAHQEARYVSRTAQRERERLAAEARRIESLLRSALALVEESAREQPHAQLPDAPPAHGAAIEAAAEPELEPGWPVAEIEAAAVETPAAPEEPQAISWRDREDTREYLGLLSQAAPETAAPPPADEPVKLPPVDDETGEDVSPGREFDWG